MLPSANGRIIKNSGAEGRLVTGSPAIAQMLVRRCADKLLQHYPQHIWHVMMSKDQSVIQVRAMDVHDQYGYTLHTLNVQDDPGLKCVLLAGGEILERGFQIRGRGDAHTQSTKLDLMGVNRKRLADKNKTIKEFIPR